MLQAMEPHDSQTRSRAGGLALALLAALALPLLVDMAAMLGGRWEYGRVLRTGASLSEATRASGGTDRFLNVYVGLGVRRLAGGAPSRVVMPTDLSRLSNRRVRYVAGKPRPPLRLSLMGTLLDGAAQPIDYDPRLTDEQVASMLASAQEVEELPWGVYVLVPTGGDSPGGRTHSREVVLLADRTGERIFVAPVSMSPIGRAK